MFNIVSYFQTYLLKSVDNPWTFENYSDETVLLKKLLSLECYLRMFHNKWKLIFLLVKSLSFLHFLNYELSHKTSFTKVVQFGMLYENDS